MDIFTTSHYFGDVRGVWNHPEQPERLDVIYKDLIQHDLFSKMTLIPARYCEWDELLFFHHIKYVLEIVALSGMIFLSTLTKSFSLEMSKMDLWNLSNKFESMYFSATSGDCARLAIGGLLELCRAVVLGHVRNGFAIIRPPY